MKTLKDYLKPPFKKHFFDDDYYIVNGEGSICKSRNYENADISDFILAAIQNEYQRVYGEPRRWEVRFDEYECEYWVCPDCKWDDTGFENSLFNFCPHCGIKLKPSEET